MAPIDRGSQDPDGTAAKARADLKANTELGLAPQEDDVTREPTVAPEEFADTKDTEGRGTPKSGTSGDALARGDE